MLFWKRKILKTSINSPGGSVYDGLGIFDTMQHINPMCTPFALVWPPAWSVSPLWNQGKRSSLQHSRIMIHQPLGGARGQARHQDSADEILYLKDQTELSDRTGQPLDRIQQDTDRDFFMAPGEAVEYGLIDSVIDKRPVQAVE